MFKTLKEALDRNTKCHWFHDSSKQARYRDKDTQKGCSRVQASVNAAPCPRCKHFAQHQLSRRPEEIHNNQRNVSDSRLCGQEWDSCRPPGVSGVLELWWAGRHAGLSAPSPYLMDFQRRALVTHRHRAKHHLPQHVGIRRAAGSLSMMGGERMAKLGTCV